MKTTKEKLTHQKGEIITTNAIRQSRYVKRMKERGLKRVYFWVTSEQEKVIRGILERWKDE